MTALEQELIDALRRHSYALDMAQGALQEATRAMWNVHRLAAHSAKNSAENLEEHCKSARALLGRVEAAQSERAP